MKSARFRSRAGLRRLVLRTLTWIYRHLRQTADPQSGLRVLTYHAIGTPIDGDVNRIYSMAQARFEQQARYLLSHYAGQFVPLTPSALAGDKLRLAITFDDGYRDNLLAAAPLLCEMRIPFTVFVWTGAVSANKAGFLSCADVRNLARCPGATIGSHTVTHRRLTECPDGALRDELRGSKSYLEDLLGCKVASLAYPHGAVDRRVRDMAADAGYEIGASTRFDINRDGRDPLLLCRTDIWADDDVATLEQKLRGDWDWNRWRSADPQTEEKRT